MTEHETYFTDDHALKLHKAYTAFIAAAIIGLISGDGHLKLEAWSICLWGLSLPLLVSLIFLNQIVRVSPQRMSSLLREIVLVLAYLLSNLGTAALLANYSWQAAAAYGALIALCSYLLAKVASHS